MQKDLKPTTPYEAKAIKHGTATESIFNVIKVKRGKK